MSVQGRLYRLSRLAAPLCLLCLLLLALDQLFPPPPLTARAASGKAAPFAQVVLARDGSLLRAFPDERHIWRYSVSLSDVSPLYLQALIIYEDRYFYAHPGVNPAALCRAAWQWLSSHRIVSVLWGLCAGGFSNRLLQAKLPQMPGSHCFT